MSICACLCTALLRTETRTKRRPRIDELHAGPALHDNGIGLHEAALVDQYTLRDLCQHGVCGRPSAANWPGTKVRISATTPSAMRSTSIASGR